MLHVKKHGGGEVLFERRFLTQLKAQRKKTRCKGTHLFAPIRFFRRDQNHHFNLASKFMRMCEHIFKKRQRPNTGQLLVKQESAKIIAVERLTAAMKRILTFLFHKLVFHKYSLKIIHITIEIKRP